MKISYKWLKDFVEIDKSPEELAKLLTSHSFEVEGVEELGAGLDQVVVGEVAFKDKHPDADKLSITKVKVSESEILDIVCGAPNVEVGQKVAVALVGAELPNGMKIEERKVRGEKSCGMICAEDELGLGKSHEGIMVLDSALEIGTPIREALGLNDSILDIDILPNRAHDCLGHYGVAREVAALTGQELKKFDVQTSVEQKNKNKVLEVEVLEKDMCRRYSAAVVNDIEVKESPDFIKARLQSCELRPINNIVDITNYIMFSFGQPMHAFDADKLNGKIVVRLAKAGEKILALDDKEYELIETDLVICDAEKPIAIAGVIGGKETAVSETTKSIIFESANFFGTNIRKTAQRLKVATDSSHRFEREIDPELTMPCLQEAVGLSGGKIVEDIIDVYFAPRAERKIEFAYDRIENLLGINIPREKVLSILNSLGFKATSEEDKIKVIVPTFRIDVEKVNDIIEEVARINGYENIAAEQACVRMAQVRQNALWEIEREIASAWKGLGFSEVYNYSLIGEKDFENFDLDVADALELKNYLSEDAKFFRTSMMPRILGNVEENLKYRDEVRIFELGRVAFKKENELPLEKKFLSGVLSSKNIDKEKLFSVGKGEVEAFLENLGFDDAKYEVMEASGKLWHGGQSAIIIIDGKTVGKMGVIHPQILSRLGMETRVFGFEIYEEELAALRKETGVFKGINKMPESEFDLAVVVDKDLEWQKIADSVFGLGDKNIIKVVPFDVYEGENIDAGKKSVAFKVICQAEDKTLGDEEIKTIMDKIIEALGKFGGEIRK
ncbi:MAG: phenylalanine--tRNA ligase subunit beta [Candidatus Pacebacteria bacterium]|nr:phenylalanine--tRNA ligase subunit beta [Candidatus Paceibacterota bacterium]